MRVLADELGIQYSEGEIIYKYMAERGRG